MIEKEKQIASLRQNLIETSSTLEAYTANFPLAILKLHDLVEQKKILKQMLQSSQKDLDTASDLLKKLLPKKQPKSILKSGKKK